MSKNYSFAAIVILFIGKIHRWLSGVGSLGV
jgi:hypothetical protein